MLDIVVFGASGFTGKFVVRYLAEKRWWSTSPHDFTLGVAGRDPEKLRDVVTAYCGTRSHLVPITVADCSDPASLARMAKSCRVLVNCVGPYTLYGESVVAACVAAGTSCLDISGESNYMDLMRSKYAQDAHISGSIIISACGFDSVPNDFGFTLMRQKLGPDATAIDSYIEGDTGAQGAGVHVTTLHSLLEAVTDFKYIAKKLSSQPRLTGQRVIPHTDSRLPGKVIVPFPGADAEIVDRSWSLSEAPKFKRGLYVALRSWSEFSMLAIGVVVIIILTLVPGMKSLIVRYPHWFTFGVVTANGPSDKQRNGTKATVHVFGRSSGGRKHRLAVTLTDPGYGATAAIIGQGALTLAMRRDSELPLKYKNSGGFLTPAHAFVERNGEKSDVITALNRSNLVRISFIE